MPKYQDSGNASVIAQTARVMVKQNHLLIDIDLSKDLGLTSTQKSISFAGPNGWGEMVPGTDITVQLHVRRPNPDYKKQR